MFSVDPGMEPFFPDTRAAAWPPGHRCRAAGRHLFADRNLSQFKLQTTTWAQRQYCGAQRRYVDNGTSPCYKATQCQDWTTQTRGLDRSPRPYISSQAQGSSHDERIQCGKDPKTACAADGVACAIYIINDTRCWLNAASGSLSFCTRPADGVGHPAKTNTSLQHKPIQKGATSC